jgi:hypothetical protein
MKKVILLISLTIISVTSFGQWNWGINFENSWYIDRIVRDTFSNPNCNWQVGHPSKTAFTSANSVPNAIVTDTLNPVPANDTSIFYLKHVRTPSAPFHVFGLHFWYMLDGDSTDFGKIEISPDSGNNWINVLTQDTTYQINWNSTKPKLSGSTAGWQLFNMGMMQWASATSGFPVLMTADTILFRFTYITDSNSSPHDGWMIDDFTLEDWYEGIEEIQNDNLISVSPNPTSIELRIHRTKVTENEKVQILNFTGQILYNNSNFIGESIDTQQLPNGIYLLKYSDSKNFSVKRFTIQH